MKFNKSDLERTINILKELGKDYALINELVLQYKDMDFDDVIYIGQDKQDYLINSLMEYHNLMMVNGLMNKANAIKELLRDTLNNE